MFGIHSTPPAIAEYIVRKLPFDTLEMNERRIFEPFSGNSVFLVAAMRRMRELLPNEMTADERHQYFVEMLAGVEIDDFAREVARLSLMLADYPNPDGWRLHMGDAFASPLFEQELAKANIVLCNPPFGKFSQDDRAHYGDLTSVWKPAEILFRVLQRTPDLLGFVLPRAFLDGRGYRKIRSLLGVTYSSLEVLALPDRVFQHSDTEAVLLLASGRNGGTVKLKSGEVDKRDLEDFYAFRKSSYEAEKNVGEAGKVFARSMWLPRLPDLWQVTAGMNRLGDLSSIHRGIEYNLPFRANKSRFVVDEELTGFVSGVQKVKGTLEPFIVLDTLFLNVSPHVMRTSAYKLPWNQPKLIVNANRQSRGHWKMTASLDYAGLVCYQNFQAVWPKEGFPLEILAAALNGPVANAFVSAHEQGRSIKVQTLSDIPIPEFDLTQQQVIASMVRQYAEERRNWLSGDLRESEAHERCSRLLRSIDAEVLRAYDLPPRVERVLLDYFAGHPRLGPVQFKGYFPPDFQALHSLAPLYFGQLQGGKRQEYAEAPTCHSRHPLSLMKLSPSWTKELSANDFGGLPVGYKPLARAACHKGSEPYERARAWLESLGDDSAFISAVSLAESEYGLELGRLDKKTKRDIRRAMATYTILSIDRHTAEIYGRVRARLFKKHAPKKRRKMVGTKYAEDLREFTSGKELGIQENDLWIVSVAVEYNLMFVTTDKAGGMRRIVDAANYTHRIQYWQ